MQYSEARGRAARRVFRKKLLLIGASFWLWLEYFRIYLVLPGLWRELISSQADLDLEYNMVSIIGRYTYVHVHVPGSIVKP